MIEMDVSRKSPPAIVFFLFITLAAALPVDLCCSHVEDNRQLYIVYMGSLPDQGDYSPAEHHQNLLHKVVAGLGHQVLYRSFGRSFNGFAAWLSDEDQDKLKEMEGVLSVFPSETLQLHTTRSWDFTGFSENNASDPSLESDIIIGVIDTGIWTGSKSFSDEGLGLVPKKWKGSCQSGPKFKCNKKVIGARTYNYIADATDEIGHGTHTASIAAGNKVIGASFNETLAKGTARGGAPSSRIAAYKVCTMGGCISANILAAFDDAIADGVDVITISVGAYSPFIKFVEDLIAIGSFHAMSKGIVTVNAAGNFGPYRKSIFHSAPWLVSVGASNIDRSFIGKVVLGDGNTLIGRSINTNSLGNEPKFPLVYANKLNSSTCNEYDIRQCRAYCIDKDTVASKIVMCTTRKGIDYLRAVGAAGVIYWSEADHPMVEPLPAVALAPDDFHNLKAYANTTGSLATIPVVEEGKDTLAPVVVSWSSRGPNNLFPDIMKPDVVAPGVGILAAFPPKLFPYENKRSVQYNIMSGTSMSCAHAAGALAYVKSLHPNCSPSSLKSALMTTARPLNASLHNDQEFAYGSGHINLVKAADPGLVYDISRQDYINLLCGSYGSKTCRALSGEDCQCSGYTPAKDLNYPSMTAKIFLKAINVSFTRVVTNVGHPNSTYKATFSADPNLTVKVIPDTLTFEGLNDKKTFEVQVTGTFPIGKSVGKTVVLSSLLVWSHGTHSIRSPIIVYMDVPRNSNRV